MSDSIIKINAGGKKFETQISTLTKYPESILAVMFNPDTDEGKLSAQFFRCTLKKYLFLKMYKFVKKTYFQCRKCRLDLLEQVCSVEYLYLQYEPYIK